MLKSQPSQFKSRQSGIGIKGRRTGIVAPANIERDAQGIAMVDSYFDSDDEGDNGKLEIQAPTMRKTIKPTLSIDSPAPERIQHTHNDQEDDNDIETVAMPESGVFRAPLPVAKKAKKAAPHAKKPAVKKWQPKSDSPYEPSRGYSSGEDEEDPLEYDSVAPSLSATPNARNEEEEEEIDDEEEEHEDINDKRVPYADDTPQPAPRHRMDSYQLDNFVAADDDDEYDEDEDANNDRDSGPLGFTPMAGLPSAARKRGPDGIVRSRRPVMQPLRHWLNERQTYTATGQNAMPEISVVRVDAVTPPLKGQRRVNDKDKKRRNRKFEGIPSPEVDLEDCDEPLKVVKREERLQYAPLSAKSADCGSAAGVYNAPSGQFAVRSVILPKGAKFRVNRLTLSTSHSFYVVTGECTVQMVDTSGDVTSFGCRKGAHFFCPTGFQARIQNVTGSEVRINHYVFNG